MPRNAALPTVSTIGLRSGCDRRKCVPTKAAAAAAIGPRPSTLVKLLDRCRCGRGTACGMRKDTSPQPYDVNVLDHPHLDHRERRHEEIKSRPFPLPRRLFASGALRVPRIGTSPVVAVDRSERLLWVRKA